MIYGYKKAFSMLELIFVIIILGIVSSIGAEIIANVYEQYIIQRAQHRASIKTELAATQIANRLAYAIPSTIVRRVDTTGTPEDINDAPNPANNYTILQWVGTDADSFKTITSSTDRRPGWSGFCDIDVWNQGNTNISTPGSNLGLATTIIGNLSKNNPKTLADASLYFPTKAGVVESPISSGTASGFTLNTAPTTIVEQYKLAWTSYALKVSPYGTLTLHYNFSPSKGTDVLGLSSILLRNVSTFRFRGDGKTIRFKLCVEEPIGEDFNITSCKEKAVF